MILFAVLLFAALSLPSIVSAAASSGCACDGVSGRRTVGGPDAAALHELVRSHPSPEQLAAFFGDRIIEYDRHSSLAIVRTLMDVIFFSEHDALRTILSRIRFPAACLQHVAQKMLKQAVWVNNFEALAFLMGQVDRLEADDGSAVVLPYWKEDRDSLMMRRLATARWEAARMQELIALVEANPAFAVNFAATSDDMFRCLSLDKAVAMVEYNGHFAGHPDMAALQRAQPTAMLRSLLANRIMGDADMALAAQRLLELGAELNSQQVEAFKRNNPRLAETHKCLEAWIEVDTKVPEEEAGE